MAHFPHTRVSRREVLRTGASLGAAMSVGAFWASGTRPACAAGADVPSRLPLITKPIPVSGERLPAIGLGTDKFYDSERVAISAELARMQQLGGTVLDTSADYGESEALVGDTLGSLGIRDRMFIATKLTVRGEGFGSNGVGSTASFERSLQRLHTRRIDLLQVHNLDGVNELMPLMQHWKQAGQVRYLGITTSEVDRHSDLMSYMRRYPLDFIQVDYSMDNRDAAKQVLPLALQRRMAVLVNIPFGYGSLLREAQRRRLPAWATDIDVTSWGQFLLKYVISHPAVTVAIPGSTQVPHLVDNQGAARGRLPDAATRRRMEQYWDAG
jgi:aryl-alcohol dehydrogenase-like predicted oxidoreductase